MSSESVAFNQIRNFVIISVLVTLVGIVTFYISAFLFLISEIGFNAFSNQYIDPAYLRAIMLHYWQYWWAYKSIMPWEYHEYFPARLFICSFGTFGFLGLVLYVFRAPIIDYRPFKKKESVHGDAHWATEKDIKKAKLRCKTGILLGRDRQGLLIADGYQHALLFAPTGSGKGVGFVIPNLLFWHESIVVHDIKLENYELGSGYRAKKLKQKTYVWSPADPDGYSHCYNPLDWISSKPGQMVDDVQKIANLILPEQEFWNNEARSLFVGVVLYLLAVPEKVKSFGEVVRTMRSDDVVYNLAVVLDTIGKVIHPVAYMNIAAFLQKADKERSGVISTMNSSLELWANPLIDTATASSDFNFLSFKRDRTSVFVGLTPDNINRLQPLMQVFYQQATEFLCRKIPKKDEPYGVLFMLDEFPTLGKMEQFQTGIAYFRGYKVRLFIIIQDTEQLKGIYEESGMNSFLSNSTYRITFAANNYETANLISQLIGNKTVKQESVNRPKFLDLNPASRSLHVSEAQRALLLPQEVIGLPRDQQILLIESSPPIKSKKIFYYNERFFKKRLLPPIEIPQQEPYDPRKFEAKSKADQPADAPKPVQQPAPALPPTPPAPPPPAPPQSKPTNLPPFPPIDFDDDDDLFDDLDDDDDDDDDDNSDDSFDDLDDLDDLLPPQKP
ncbi:MAG: type IV secretory system conjugative DNA transfer family protein [Alphaproteobacteria bacterium]|nr:type IV secretory system conjugative DNA transfer family protein [Alphaproteobacteria bacterium]